MANDIWMNERTWEDDYLDEQDRRYDDMAFQPPKKPTRLDFCTEVEFIGPYSTPRACGCCKGCRVEYHEAFLRWYENTYEKKKEDK
jgi:hypothetical protein